MDNLHKGQKLTLEEAVETLNGVVELDVDRDAAVALSNDIELISEENLSQTIIQLIKEENFEECLDVIKETFRVILHYLRHYDKKDYSFDSDTIETINSIMVLVGEAAKKIDKYAVIIHHEKELCITKLKEYKRLHEFYHNRIAQKVDNGLLSKWIMGLSNRVFQKSIVNIAPETKTEKMPSNHIFVDLDSVKKDSEYELFFIRKDDGSRFFSPRLIRNIKLICDFGKYITESRTDDPLISLPIWRDHCFQENAKDILEACTTVIENFSQYQNHEHHDSELNLFLNKAVMALILCSKPHNIWHDPAVKSSKDYFADFQWFLRKALSTREHNDYLAYPTQASKFSQVAIDLTQALSKALFLDLKGLEKLNAPISKIIAEFHQNIGRALASDILTSKLLLEDYTALAKAIKPHSSGPMINVIDQLESGKQLIFDPLLQNNLPNRIFSIKDSWGACHNIFMPSPTKQESINEVTVCEEFKEFLHALPSDDHHLIINFQDRISWRECARANILEELQFQDNFIDKLSVVSLPKDTEFYHQQAPYNQDNHVDLFLRQFIDQIESDSSGFFFPEAIQKDFSKKTVTGILHSIHTIFFGKKNVLPRERRLDFIEIAYLFLELKLIDIIKASSFSLVCKDGIDTSAAANAQLYFFIQALSGKAITTTDWQKLNQIIHNPVIFVRERVMLAECFTRMNSTIKCIEAVREDLGVENFANIVKKEFAPYYSKDYFELLAKEVTE